MIKNSEFLIFTKIGFKTLINNDLHIVNWLDILSIYAYKIDLITVDSIVLEINTNNDLTIKITEESIYWEEFIKEMIKNIPNINSKWIEEIIKPPFKTNNTLIYEKN